MEERGRWLAELERPTNVSFLIKERNIFMPIFFVIPAVEHYIVPVILSFFRYKFLLSE